MPALALAALGTGARERRNAFGVDVKGVVNRLMVGAPEQPRYPPAL